MALFLTADPHHGHTNILRYCPRPFPDVATMDAALVDTWNDTVRPADEVWVLGDFALGRLRETLLLLGRLHGHKHLLPGNHDTCWPGHRKAAREQRRYLDAGFESILNDPTTLHLAGRTVTLSHFPYAGAGDHEGRSERYGPWRPVDEGGWLVHGHIHERWRVRGRQINVGVDAWAGRPVPVETVEAYVTADQPVHEAPLPWP